VANDERLSFLGLRTVPDAVPGAGSLGGIYSAVAGASTEHCLVVACDMPFLAVPLLRALAAERRDYDVLAPFITVGENRQGKADGVYETLHAIYGRGVLPAIEEQLAAGRFRIVGFFPQVRVRALPEEAVRHHDPELRSFFNVNTPERLIEARRLATSSNASSTRRTAPPRSTTPPSCRSGITANRRANPTWRCRSSPGAA
jgi:molybdopterin-guanine dinucleotide biosynthesis protein A